MFNIFVIQ